MELFNACTTSLREHANACAERFFRGDIEGYTHHSQEHKCDVKRCGAHKAHTHTVTFAEEVLCACGKQVRLTIEIAIEQTLCPASSPIIESIFTLGVPDHPLCHYTRTIYDNRAVEIGNLNGGIFSALCRSTTELAQQIRQRLYSWDTIRAGIDFLHGDMHALHLPYLEMHDGVMRLPRRYYDKGFYAIETRGREGEARGTLVRLTADSAAENA